MEVKGAKPVRNVDFLTSGGQINSQKYKKSGKLIHFVHSFKLDVNMFLYALKQNFMKIEFKNSIRRLSFFLLPTRHQNCLDKSLVIVERYILTSFLSISITEFQFVLENHLKMSSY